jgi:hypothetical protein
VIVIGVDPGSNFTGAAVHDGSGFVFWLESDDPITIMDAILGYPYVSDLVVVLEDFLGAGYLDRHKKRTIEVLGYIYHSCRAKGITVKRVDPQRRLSNTMNVPAKIRGKDERAAAAHVLSYLEKT